VARSKAKRRERLAVTLPRLAYFIIIYTDVYILKKPSLAKTHGKDTKLQLE